VDLPPYRRVKTALLALFIAIHRSFGCVIAATFIVAKMQLHFNKNVTANFCACHVNFSSTRISPDLSVGYPRKMDMKIRVVTTR